MNTSLIDEYLKFTQIRNLCDGERVDLSSHSWMYPTTILPLITFLRDNNISYIEPKSPRLSSYLSNMMTQQNVSIIDGKTYLPFTNLPTNRIEANSILNKILSLPDIGKNYGGEQAFQYVIMELVDNVYQHSEFTSASIIAQKYPTMKFLEVSIYDNGISIPGCFEKVGIKSEDCDSIIDAINGLSTKDIDRGFGLRSCIRIFTEGIRGEILVVSRNGAILLKGESKNGYKLNKIIA